MHKTIPEEFHRNVSEDNIASIFNSEDGGNISSETSVYFQLTIRRYIPEDNHGLENLKFYKTTVDGKR
jgi:hypothetical protein